MNQYTTEREGQLDFYRRFLPRVNPALNLDEIMTDNHDGIIGGNLIEFKLRVTDLNATLFQCVKYLSALRIKGNPCPANVIIVDLNAGTAWRYHSEHFLSAIEKPYTGGASKDNSGFLGGTAKNRLAYDKNQQDAESLIALLKETHFTKIHIDENCIVGWAEHFYRVVPGARKEDFIGDDTGKHKTIGEIRKPMHFKDYLHAYTGETNVKFNYLMDKLNDFLLKKGLGAFYTPPAYVEKALELVREAIARVPVGNDYIILDRCAGTGNLEQSMTDDELGHCIVSTVEYYEYKVLQELIGAKVRHIIPPVESTGTFNAGLVTGADALTNNYVHNPVVCQYIDNPACTVILFENPPYADTTSVEHQRRGVGTTSSVWKNRYVVREMKKEVKGTATNELGNAFIWSGFHHYLRQPTDSYVVFSPVKYWKAQHLVKKKFLRGFAFNRRHFHTNIDACIMCALWANVDDTAADMLTLTGYDIINGVLTEYPQKLPVNRIYSYFSGEYFDKRTFPDDEKGGILCEKNGVEKTTTNSIRCKPIRNENIIGYMAVYSSNFDNPDNMASLLVAGRYDGNGFFLRRDNYLEKLPMFAASRYITYNRAWTERARIMKSADGAADFARDVANGKLTRFLLQCLLFTCLETQNHMRSFTGSDGRFYRNELCLDSTNGETIASHDIARLQANESETALLRQWKTVLNLAKQTKYYNPALTYGVYQISAELDTFRKDETTGKTIRDYIELHSALKTLKELCKTDYNAEIVPVLFAYQFLK